MKNTLLFLAGIGFQEILLLLIFPIFICLIVVALRPLFLWYWKVNSVEKLLIEQNYLLKSIQQQLVEQNKK